MEKKKLWFFISMIKVSGKMTILGQTHTVILIYARDRTLRNRS